MRNPHRSYKSGGGGAVGWVIIPYCPPVILWPGYPCPGTVPKTSGRTGRTARAERVRLGRQYDDGRPARLWRSITFSGKDVQGFTLTKVPRESGYSPPQGAHFVGVRTALRDCPPMPVRLRGAAVAGATMWLNRRSRLTRGQSSGEVLAPGHLPALSVEI